MWKNRDRFIAMDMSSLKTIGKQGIIIDDKDQDSLVVCFDWDISGFGVSDLNIPDGHGAFISSHFIKRIV